MGKFDRLSGILTGLQGFGPSWTGFERGNMTGFRRDFTGVGAVFRGNLTGLDGKLVM